MAEFAVLVAGMAVYGVACYFIVRWMIVRKIMSWADHMEPYYKPRFIAGIRYAAGIADSTAHEPLVPSGYRRGATADTDPAGGDES